MSREDTLNAIHSEGMKEFLEHGFMDASLRNIAKRAGVTTGAFYGYYSSKEELFDFLVKAQYDAVMNHYRKAHEAFRKLTHDEQISRMGEISGECLSWMNDYVHENLEVFRLIICCSEGTKYADMIHEMSELEAAATDEFTASLNLELDPMLVHMISSGILSAFFETVRHNMTKSRADSYIESLKAFDLAGWRAITHTKER